MATLSKILHAIVWQEDDLFVAKAVELEISSQGYTKTEAFNNLVEAIELYFEDEKLPYESLPSFQNISLKTFDIKNSINA